jgi:hypothetical protein
MCEILGSRIKNKLDRSIRPESDGLSPRVLARRKEQRAWPDIHFVCGHDPTAQIVADAD